MRYSGFLGRMTHAKTLENFQMTTLDLVARVNERRLQGAINYALADKSDPFTLARCKAHMRNGIVGYCQDGDEAIYSAELVMEMRKLPDGREYPVTVYRNIQRP